jgi:VWFA-related protein
MKVASQIQSLLLAACFVILCSGGVATAQKPSSTPRVRTVSIPVSIYTKDEMRAGRTEELLQVDVLTVTENNQPQKILSVRSVEDAPLSVAILIQDDLTSSVNLQLTDLRQFIRGLPEGSRVMVAYLRSGSMETRQRFTTDRDRAARALRIVASTPSVSPRNPYDGVLDALNRFDALPAGRRAILLVSDGLDTSQDIGGATPSQSTDLERAIQAAQRKSVAVFSFYSPTVITERGRPQGSLLGQGSLQKLADETGGRAFFSGSSAPVSFVPFLKDLNLLLTRQFYLTYLSENTKRGYYRVEVKSSNPAVKIEHPRGYYYR